MSRQLTHLEEARFFHQFAALLEASFSVQHSLGMAGKNCRASFQRYLQQASAEVGTGKDLATVLSYPPRPFDGWTLSLIRMAEQSGALAEICQKLAVVAEQNHRRSKLYHSIGLSTIAVILSLFALLTALLQGNTNFLTQPGFWLLGFLLVAMLIISTQYLSSSHTSANLRQRVAELPIAGKILQAQSMLYLSELALPLRCGVSILAALELVRNRVPDPALRSNLAIAARQIRIGHSLSDSLRGKLPTIALQFICTGEETGNLDDMLQKLAEHYEGELERLLRQLQGILRPLSILAIAAFVLLTGMRVISSIVESLPSG